MATTRVFRSGHSQAVRIPRAYRFQSGEVEIFRRGEEVVLREHPKNLASAFELLAGLSTDFFSKGRRQPRLDRRNKL